MVDLNAEFAGLEKVFRRMVGGDIEWTISLAPGLGRIRADPGQIQQVMRNLVVNARAAMPYGGKLTVVTENVEFREPHAENDFIIPPGSYVSFAVADTGVGFEGKGKGKGDGLGLGVTYGIVKQIGGYMCENSAFGKGATIKIYLPRMQTILLVEDDEVVRTMMGRVLRENGYAVLEAGRADEALKLVEPQMGALHLLLTDMVLPDINGIELAKRIASIRPAAKLLLISGYFDKDFEHFIVDKKVPFISKPFVMAALLKKVREVLEAKPSE